jgi:NAD(P)H dehydrogenase (quinone)
MCRWKSRWTKKLNGGNRQDFVEVSGAFVCHSPLFPFSIRPGIPWLLMMSKLSPGVLLWLVGLFFLSLGCSHVDAQAQVQSQGESIQVLVAYHSLSGNTAELAKSVGAGARSIPGTSVILHKVGDVTAEVLFGSDALVVGSPVYWSNMSGEVKTFFDRWQFEFGVFPELKMRNKVGAAFATGGQMSSGKEVTMLTILAAMLGNRMIVVSDGGAFGASATTEGDSPGINDAERADAWALGKRVAEVAWMVKRGQALPAQP